MDFWNGFLFYRTIAIPHPISYIFYALVLHGTRNAFFYSICPHRHIWFVHHMYWCAYFILLENGENISWCVLRENVKDPCVFQKFWYSDEYNTNTHSNSQSRAVCCVISDVHHTPYYTALHFTDEARSVISNVRFITWLRMSAEYYTNKVCGKSGIVEKMEKMERYDLFSIPFSFTFALLINQWIYHCIHDEPFCSPTHIRFAK